jgi:hypothetical protein
MTTIHICYYLNFVSATECLKAEALNYGQNLARVTTNNHTVSTSSKQINMQSSMGSTVDSCHAQTAATKTTGLEEARDVEVGSAGSSYASGRR